MERYINKSALVAEIERLRRNQRLDDRHDQWVLDGLHAIEKFIKSQEAQEEPVSEDLEVEVMEYSNTHNDECFDAIGDKCQFVINAFKAGAQWQLNQIRKENEKNRD